MTNLTSVCASTRSSADPSGKTLCTLPISMTPCNGLPKTTSLSSGNEEQMGACLSKARPSVEERFLEAIRRRRADVVRDYNHPIKEGHWSWFLFPLLRDPFCRPSMGTELYYLYDDAEIVDYLRSPSLMVYYEEMMRFLLLKKDMRSWLGGTDYYKLLTHMVQFEPVARKHNCVQVIQLYENLHEKVNDRVKSL